MKLLCLATLLLVGLAECQSFFGYGWGYPSYGYGRGYGWGYPRGYGWGYGGYGYGGLRRQGYGGYGGYGYGGLGGGYGYGYPRGGIFYGRSLQGNEGAAAAAGYDVLIPVAATGSSAQQVQATPQVQPTVVQVVPSTSSGVQYEQGTGYAAAAAPVAEVSSQSVNYQPQVSSQSQQTGYTASNVVVPPTVGAQVVMVPSVPMPAQMYQASSVVPVQSVYHVPQQQQQHQQQVVSHVQQPTIVSVHEPKALEPASQQVASQQQQQTVYPAVGHVVPSAAGQQVPFILPLGPSSTGSYVAPPVRATLVPSGTPFAGNAVIHFVPQPLPQHHESVGHHQVSQVMTPYVPGQVGQAGGYTSSSFYETVPSVSVAGAPHHVSSGELVNAKNQKVDESVVVDGKRYRLRSITVVTQPKVLVAVEEVTD